MMMASPKAPDDYLRKQIFCLSPDYIAKRSGVLRKAIIEHPDFPKQYTIQRFHDKEDVVVEDGETKMQVSVHLAPVGWYGSEQRQNAKTLKNLNYDIVFATEPPKDYVFFKEIPLPDPIPLHEPLVDDQELSRIKGCCVYNSDNHSLCIYRHKVVASLWKLVTSFCVPIGIQNASTLYLYSPEVVQHRITRYVEMSYSTNGLDQVIALYEQLPKLSLEGLCNLLINEALRHQHMPHIELVFAENTKYPADSYSHSNEKNKELLGEHVETLFRFIHGRFILESLLTALCCDYVVDSLFLETVYLLIKKKKDEEQ